MKRLTLRDLGALLIASLAVGVASAAPPGVVQSQRLVALKLSLGAAPASSALASIWQDRLRAEQAKLAALPNGAASTSAPTAPVFVATFKDGDRTIVVSALFTTPECQNFSGAASPNLNACPMRVAVLRNDQVKVVALQNEFPFVAAMKNASDAELPEYDDQSLKDRTVVTFNSATREVTTALTLNGVLDVENSAPIHIAY